MSHWNWKVWSPNSREPFQEPQSLETPRSQDTCREITLTYWDQVPRKFSTITSWYSFLWAESSNPSSSSVKATATSLKVTASYNKQCSAQSYSQRPVEEGQQLQEGEEDERSCSGSCAMCRLLSPLLPSCQHHALTFLGAHCKCSYEEGSFVYLPGVPRTLKQTP